VLSYTVTAQRNQLNSHISRYFNIDDIAYTLAYVLCASPDGLYVYVATGSTVDSFSRNSVTGALSFIGTTSYSGSSAKIAMSDDGLALYVIAPLAISQYQRNIATGVLSTVNTIAKTSGM